MAIHLVFVSCIKIYKMKTKNLFLYNFNHSNFRLNFVFHFPLQNKFNNNLDYEKYESNFVASGAII